MCQPEPLIRRKIMNIEIYYEEIRISEGNEQKAKEIEEKIKELTRELENLGEVQK